jgi:hypothetical protein
VALVAFCKSLYTGKLAAGGCIPVNAESQFQEVSVAIGAIAILAPISDRVGFLAGLPSNSAAVAMNDEIRTT